MTLSQNFDEICDYFDKKLKTYGPTPRGADWNSDISQQLRFNQLLKIISNPKEDFSLLDYGSGYGALLNHMQSNGFQCHLYIGFDILESMIETAWQLHPKNDHIIFTTELEGVQRTDYAIASGVFNIRLQAPYEDWTNYTLDCLSKLNNLTNKGFSANFLTKYSDPAQMRPDLYYADPCFLFDYCKTHFSKDVAILHDYDLYDFTLLVRKFSKEGK
jgi:SAM-dependent methyltransferase